MAKYKIKQLPENINVPDGAKAIPLTRGYYTLVDDEDYEFLSQWNWQVYINPRLRTQYAQKRTLGKMHRFIMNAPKGMQIDHINGDGLDNRKRNLRVCTHQQNTYNRKPRGFLVTKGVRQVDNKWNARIQYKGKRYYLGNFNTQEEAQTAYNMAAKKLFKEYSRIIPVKNVKIHQGGVDTYYKEVHALVECLVCDALFMRVARHHKYCCNQCKENARSERRRR